MCGTFFPSYFFGGLNLMNEIILNQNNIHSKKKTKQIIHRKIINLFFFLPPLCNQHIYLLMLKKK